MAPPNRNVFLNCPFDDAYKDLFDAAVFTIFRSGFVARCALETDDAAVNRFQKISRIVRECRYGVHDISRTELDGDPSLPRFNMPLELGLFLGARAYGGRKHSAKACMIFDREPHRFQRYISDIAGRDIHAHGGAYNRLIRELAGWLRSQSKDDRFPAGQSSSPSSTRSAPICRGFWRPAGSIRLK